MKVEYRYSQREHEFLDKTKYGNIFERSCHIIQKTWMKIHACRKELIDLYCRQANLKNKEESEWGICINDMTYLPEKLFDCSVGMVRKTRNGVKNPDGTCKTCPYFIKEEEVKSLYRNR